MPSPDVPGQPYFPPGGGWPGDNPGAIPVPYPDWHDYNVPPGDYTPAAPPGDYTTPVPGPAPAPAPPGTGPGPVPPGGATDQPPGNVAPGIYDTASAWIGAATGFWGNNPLFRVTKRTTTRIRNTRLGNFAVKEARIGLRALSGWWTGGEIIGAASPSERVAAALANAENWAALGKWAGYTGLGTVVSYALGFLTNDNPANDNSSFPLALGTRGPRFGFFGPVERGPERGSLADPAFSRIVKQMVFADAFTRSRQKVSPAVEQLLGPPDVLLSQRAPTIAEEMERVAQLVGIGRVFNPKGWVPAVPFRMVPNATVITATAPGFGDFTPPGGEAPTPDQLAALGQIGPPVPSRTSTQGTGPLAPRTRGGGFGLGAMPWPVVGLLGAVVATAVLRRERRGNEPSGFALPAVPSTPGAQPVTPPATSTGPQIGSFALGGFSGSGAYCEPAPRGPRRKCLERAPVSWRAGRNKGKNAGTKCLRYAARKS